jgi:integrase
LTLRDTHKIEAQVLTGEARLKDIRDIALLLVGKDLLARASELVSLTVGAVAFDIDDGTAQVALRRRKTSTDSQECLIGPEAAGALQRWLQAAAVTSGPLFRSVTKAGTATDVPLSTRDVGRILKSLAVRARLDPSGVSSHSMRVGTAVDCVAANIDAASIMQAGGWTSVRMVARYTARLAAKRGAIARLHRLSG